MHAAAFCRLASARFEPRALRRRSPLDGLAFGGPLPDEVSRLPSGLTQVWLITGVRAGGVVCGNSRRGLDPR